MHVLVILLSLLPTSWAADTEAGVGCRFCSELTPIQCSLSRVTAEARRLGASLRSKGQCLPAVRKAFLNAGCIVPNGFANNAMQAFKAMQDANPKKCRAGQPASAAPEGAVIFSRRPASPGCRASHHTEIKSGNCYYSDFHHPDCAAATEYQDCPYTMLGWCVL